MNFTKPDILKFAALYDNRYLDKEDASIEEEIKQILKQRKPKFLTKDELIKIAKWKSPRTKKHVESEENDNCTVKAITEFSFSTQSERARIESLLVLKGVSWPTASAILHFTFPDKYPILDFRVLESIKWDKPSQYNFSFWKKYCLYLRELAKSLGVSLRTLDKALWEKSKS